MRSVYFAPLFGRNRRWDAVSLLRGKKLDLGARAFMRGVLHRGLVPVALAFTARKLTTKTVASCVSFHTQKNQLPRGYVTSIQEGDNLKE